MKNLFKNLTAAFAIPTLFAQADIPDSALDELHGMYKIGASNDPVFPLNGQQEWFLDFGTVTSDGKTSGSVAISLRRNPSVRVRIMAWQFFPEKRALHIGNPFHEDSTQAVSRGNWQLRTTRGKLILERENYQVILYPTYQGR